MSLKERVAEARRALILASNEVPEPIDPAVGAKFGELMKAMIELTVLVDSPTPVLSCPHDPLRCRGCIENACFN